ncbi:hypothetical protein ACGFMM_34495 [Streptomyces sp. NPDC048604]|uniref:hypothetical protein n=1 Tax=Streptomyces sp. NPDC048604 TaxID=3365578 RepID=UPI0037235456
MTTAPLPGTKYEFVEHRLEGRLVVDPDGRMGILAAVVLVRDRQSGREISRTAHVRPTDGSGVEWTTAKPEALRPGAPITPNTAPKSSAWAGADPYDVGPSPSPLL